MEKEQEPRESVSSETREEEKQRGREAERRRRDRGGPKTDLPETRIFFSKINNMYIVFSKQ